MDEYRKYPLMTPKVEAATCDGFPSSPVHNIETTCIMALQETKCISFTSQNMGEN